MYATFLSSLPRMKSENKSLLREIVTSLKAAGGGWDCVE